MNIELVTEHKKEHLDLLLLADPSEHMIDRYLEPGDLYYMRADGEVVCLALVLPLDDVRCELKNIATREDRQGRGYACAMIEALCERYRGRFEQMLVGTAALGQSFYERRGFAYSHTVKNFFVDNYPEPLIEEGVQHIDMVYLSRSLA